ncbi:MAG: AMP-binding protein [Acidobacteria bacterium]|nr:AMP-binding protein [Acidobacteriota bacterium]MBV9435362.1 AMP-binding protein [Acidobacteriota bacterium]
MIFRSPYPDTAIPDVPFQHLILSRAEQWGAIPAFLDPDAQRTVTFAGFASEAQQVAAGLARHGMRKRDVFALMLPNVPEFATAFFGVLSAGGIVTTMNPMYTADEIANQLRDSGAKYLLTIPQCLDRVTAGAACTQLREVFVIGNASGATSFTDLLGDRTIPDMKIDPFEDVAVLPYSSGTSGKQKGVMLTHANLIASVLATSAAFPLLKEGSKDLGLMPFFHIGGMVCILLLCLYAGTTVVLMRRFDPALLLRTIQDHRVEFVPLVPPIISALAQYPDLEHFNFSSMKVITSSAAPLSVSAQEKCEQRLGVPVIQGYGMTEMAGLTHGSIETAGLKKPATVGPCVPNVLTKVVDPGTGLELGPNEPGEIYIGGPQVMKGYLNNPEASAVAVDAEGWYHTGDIGYADEDGYFYIVDRVKELIKCNAFQVAPAELESILVSHPAIPEAAVIGSPDEKMGEVPKAFVVVRQPVAAEDVIEFVATRVASYKQIRKLEFVDSLPKSPAGKLLRRVLRERESQSQQA